MPLKVLGSSCPRKPCKFLTQQRPAVSQDCQAALAEFKVQLCSRPQRELAAVSLVQASIFLCIS